MHLLSRVYGYFLVFVFLFSNNLFATPFGFQFGVTNKEMNIDTSDISNILVEHYVDVQGDSQTTFTIWVKLKAVPEPCKGLDEYLIEFDALNRPFKIYGRTKSGMAKKDCAENRAILKKWLLNRYSSSEYEEKPSGTLRIQYDPENNRTVDLYCSGEDNTPMVMYIDHNLFAAHKISKSKLKLDPNNRGLIAMPFGNSHKK